MQYIILDTHGREGNPISEELLIEMAKNGKIHSETLIRNTLVSRYRPAIKILCLDGSLCDNSSKKTPKVAIATNLHRSVGSITSPGINYRLGAAFIDQIVLAILIIGSFNIFRLLGDSIDTEVTISYFISSSIAIPLSYYSICLAVRAQTFGFWFFGIMIVKGEEDAVYFGRAFIMSLLYLLTLPLAAVFIFVFEKSIHEALSGTKVVNVRLG